MNRIFRTLPLAVVTAALGLMYFSATSHAATAAVGDDTSILDLIKPVYEAFANHQYGLMGALVVIVVVAILKRYFGDKIPFLHTDAGGSLLALFGAGATALGASLASPGAHLTLDLFKSALMFGVVAAGGYAMIKNLLIEPLLRPLAAKAPAWMQPIFNAVFWIFDHAPGSDGAAAIAAAEKAGTAAVAGAQGDGIGDVIGKPREIP